MSYNKVRSAVDDHKKKSRHVKKLWRKGFSDLYESTDMKPRHVVTFNVLFLAKRFIFAFILVLYKYLKGSFQIYCLVAIQAIFMVPYFILWKYQTNIVRKVTMIIADLIALIILAFPIIASSGDSAAAQGKVMIVLFTVCIVALVIACLIALIVDLILGYIQKKKEES